MPFLKEVKALLFREALLEWKQKYALNGLLLYVASMVFVISLAFLNEMTPETWNVTFWIIMLFVAINAIAKSFMGESRGQMFYLYTVAGPHSVIAAKMFYNSILLIFIGFVTLLLFAFLTPNNIKDLGLYLGVIALGSIGFAANLTLVSAIAARAQNKATLLAVLSFPLTIPLLLTSVRASRNAMLGFERSKSYEELVFLIAFIVIIALVSFILFPFLWKD